MGLIPGQGTKVLYVVRCTQNSMEICCMDQETQTGALYQPRGEGMEGDGREVEKGEEICIPMADSC